MANTEQQLKQATQVAYLECLEKGEKNLILEGKKGPFSVKTLILAALDLEPIRQKAEADGIDYEYASIQKIIKYSDLSELDKQIISQFEDEILNWKIIDIHNMTQENGFYGCVIETSDENAIVGFRGSEGLKDYPGLINDWVKADFGLLNSVETAQAKECERYALGLDRNKILEKYKTIDVSGHSLGGNLASHFSIICASKDQTQNIFNKIDTVCNFDGPGVSDEYIEAHRKGIEKAGSKIKHYKWSPVGNLLYDIPGENEIFLKTRKYYGDGGNISKLGYYTFGKHDSRSLIFDNSGNAIRGKEDFLSKKLKQLSLEFEKYPELTHSAYAVVASVLGQIVYQKEDGEIGFKLPFITMSDDYKNRNMNFENFKFRCGNLINGFGNVVANYTKDLYRKTALQTNTGYSFNDYER